MPISIDTCWSEVVEKAYDYIGDFIVNDITAGENDPQMLPTVGRLGLTYVAMHMRGDSMTMQQLTDYDDVVDDVIRYFNEFSEKAAENGIRKWILDPGFGFAKNIQQNYTLLNELNRLRQVSRDDGLTPKILVGVSRKSMIYKLLGISPEDSLPATQVLHFAAMQNGADILRVHDVAEAVRTRDLYNMVALSQFAK
jgi:dihydropteroate synthase